MVSRRAFLGAVGAALAAASAPKVLAPVLRRKPQYKQISVAQNVPMELSLDEMEERYIRPAVEMLVERMDRELLVAYCKLPDVRGVMDCRQMTIRPNIPIRVLTAYSAIYDENVMRLDCGFYA